MDNLLDRRRFLQALAASVVAVGGVLPIGFPERTFRIALPPGNYNYTLYGTVTGRWSAKSHMMPKAWNITHRVRNT